VAVPLPGTPTLAAISISGPQSRLPLTVIDDVVPIMRRPAERLAHSLSV
jgi:IclR family acetate operon transcriptional repressor